MAEEFLTLMADLDDESQQILGGWYEKLREEDVFMSPVLDHGVVTWMDGEIDCSQEYMYDNSYEYAQVI